MRITKQIWGTPKPAMTFVRRPIGRGTVIAPVAAICVLLGLIGEGRASEGDAEHRDSLSKVAATGNAPGIISGRVMNRAGDPIPDAAVEIQFLMSGDPISPPGEGDSVPDIFHRTPSVKTDENGGLFSAIYRQAQWRDSIFKPPVMLKRSALE